MKITAIILAALSAVALAAPTPTEQDAATSTCESADTAVPVYVDMLTVPHIDQCKTHNWPEGMCWLGDIIGDKR